jgi:DNA-binding MurR/RpiR family transcriptional regulator
MLEELLRGSAADLTPSERRIAKLVADDPTLLAFSTVAALAESAGTSGPTVVRFATKLGFAGFGDLQDAVRGSLTDRLQRADERIRDGADPRVGAAGALLVENVAASMGRLSERDVLAAGRLLAGVRGHVFVCSSEATRAVGILLAQSLGQLRPGVVELHGSEAANATARAPADDGDVAIMIDFSRYERWVVDLDVALRGVGVTTMAITDGALSPLATHARQALFVERHAVGPFDSVLGACAVAETVVAATARRLRTSAARRLDAIEAAWRADDVVT